MIMDIFSLAIVIFLIGLALLVIGIVLAKICKTTEKIHQRGFDRFRRSVGFFEGMVEMFQNPDIFIPMILTVYGVLFIIASFLLAFVSIFI